jgi:hypothetical protein
MDDDDRDGCVGRDDVTDDDVAGPAPRSVAAGGVSAGRRRAAPVGYPTHAEPLGLSPASTVR